ncbi:MAG: beta-lactamase family protein [Acidobacteria bacterium]|nr:beta-lactamase family protein [Acidobacteriota bacterium]MBI3655649.1 beta-lactamase family protein [Acidobacteriota bacterium]
MCVMPWVTRCRVPDSLVSVSTRSENEVEPRSVGADLQGVANIWQAVERLYASGMHPAIQLCVRRRGHVLIDRSIGHACGNGPQDSLEAGKTLCTPDTPFTIFSASKAVTAMVIHLLDQKHLLHIDDPVSEYIPEFGKHGKERVTIEQVLTHRAGMPNLPFDEMKLEYLTTPHKILQRLCEAEPAWAPGRRLAYHAVTGGFILAEIVQRVTRRTIRRVLDEEILSPLGFRWMNYGVKPRDISKVAVNYFTGLAPFFPVSTIIRRALGVDFTEAAELSNDPRFLTSIIPSANVVTNANELSRFYQLLLNGGVLDGVQIFEPRTIRRATSEQSYLEFDFTLGLPLRYSMGFMLGGLGLYGPDTPQAFGHVGFINIFSWADPERQVAVALTTSGKPIVYWELYYIYAIMREIGLTCPKEPARAWRAGAGRRIKPAKRSNAAGRRGGRDGGPPRKKSSASQSNKARAE